CYRVYHTEPRRTFMTGSIATRQLHARQRAIAVAVSIAIPLEFLSVTVFSWKHKTSPVLFAAAAVDSVIFCGGALWILSRWAGGYAQLGLTPRRWLKMFAMAAVISSAVGWVLRIPEIIVVRWLVVSAELAFTAVILFAIIRTARALPREGFWNQVRLKLSQHLPSIVVKLGTTELELLSSGVCSLIRPRVHPYQVVFTTLRTSQSGFLLPFIALASLVEMPALHIALRFWLHSSYVAHAVLLGLHLYGLLWLLGDRRLIRETGHR